jgi:isoquinoline 1-oxidoreductase beta subunit
VTVALDRKDFLRVVTVGGVGLTLGLEFVPSAGEAAPAADFSPVVWVKMHPDGRNTVVLNSSEMGQGVATSLPMMLADELDVPMSSVSFEFSPATVPYYNPVLKGLETDGSRTTPTMGPVMRKAGATARALLVAAAAQRWSVSPAACTTQNAVVTGPNGQKAKYTDLLALAATLPVPADVTLKTSDQFRIIGTRHSRLDVGPKSNGRAMYGMDVKVPGMKYAAIAKPRQIGATVGSYDASAALTVPGVRKVVQVPQGIAVLADNTWAAFQGRKALKIDWQDGPNAKVSTAQIYATARELVKKPGAVQRQQGDVNAALAAAKPIEAVYESPYLAHATMEPLNATADVRADRVTIWTGSQNQTLAQKLASTITGIPIENISVNTVFLGGGFGRRGWPDFVGDAVAVSKAAGMPVKVVWSREDDINNDRFRGGSVHALSGAVSADGKIVALRHTMASSSQVRIELPFLIKDGLDPLSGSGMANHPYKIPNQLMSWQELPFKALPVGFWRAPYANINVFATESFIDELAKAAGQDPVVFRLANLDADSKAANVLRRVANIAKWTTPPPAGRARGVAVALVAGGWIATAVEVSMPNNKPVVHRVWNSVDVGQPINLDGLEQQIESSILFGLGAALMGKITFENGAPVQTNFDGYHVLKMQESPEIITEIVPSHEPSVGAGETAVPCVMAALTNAIFALNGNRIRTLPISDSVT